MGKCTVTCEFNPDRDCLEVVSGLAVNITDMMQTGIVQDGGSELDYNGIDDPNAVIGLVRDNFAAIDAMRAVRKYGRKSDTTVAAASAAAAVAGAPAPTHD